MSYAALKLLHVGCVILSIGGFLLRGTWMVAGSRLLRHPVTRTLPHAIDAVLLLSGIALVFRLSLNPLDEPWLLAKFGALVIYVLFGSIALRYGATQRIRAAAFVGAVIVFAYIAGTALAHSPWSWTAMPMAG